MSGITSPDGGFTTAEKRRRYGRLCACGCGQLTSGSDGKENAPRYVQECLNRIRREQAQQRVIKAIRRWHREFGRLPGARQWLFRVPDYDWAPRTGDILQYFGSWNAAIEAAGFEPRKPGEREVSYRSRVAA